MKMTAQRFRLVLLGILGLLFVVFLLIFFAGLTLLKSESQSMVDLKLKNKTADAQLTNLAISKNDIEKYSYFKDIARTVIPNDKDQAQAVLDISQLAQQSGISIQSITFPTSNLGLKAPTSSGSAASTDATSNSSATKVVSQATPVTGIPGLYAVQLTISPASGPTVPVAQQVTYPKMLDFLSHIEKNRRTAQIAQVNIQNGNGTQLSLNQLSFTLVINIFIKP